MNRAWVVNENGTLKIFFKEEPEYDKENKSYLGYRSELLDVDSMPITQQLQDLQPGDPPVEVILSPIDCVHITKTKAFFTELATKMRYLWPQGDKSEKYAWRDSVPNLVKRLETLWDLRKLGNYSIDDCLTVARQYLSLFETNTKYMQVIKYYILKQKEIVGPDGRIKYYTESRFADMLEGKQIMDVAQEFESLMSGHNNDNLI